MGTSAGLALIDADLQRLTNLAPPDVSKALEKLVDAPHVAVAGDLWAGAAPGSSSAALSWISGFCLPSLRSLTRLPG